MKKLLPLILLLFIVHCTQRIAGTTDETVTGTRAAIYYANGTPAPGVTVKAFDINDTSRVPAAQAITDNTGHYALGQIAKGTYNIWAEQDTLVAVQDSVFISPTTNTLHHDTLQASGSITAIIGMQPNDDPRSAYVQMTGSDRFSRNINTDGSFTINGLATGSYSLRISTTLPNYTPTFFTVSAVSGKADTLKDTLQLVYTGIPVVTGLSASYDTVNGVVHLSWNSTSFRDFQDYLIFRDPCDSIQPSMVPIKSVTDTIFSDTIFKKNNAQGQFSFSDTNDYCFKYRVCVRNNSNVQGLTYKNIAVISVSLLYKIPQVKIISSDTMYCNTPITLIASIANNLSTIKKCEWKIGQNGQYATTSVTQPETTIVLPDTLLSFLRCYIRVTNSYGNVAYDSMDLQVFIGWQDDTVSMPPSFELLTGTNEIVFNNQLFVFGTGQANTGPNQTMSIWTLSNGTWTALTNSAPFPHSGYRLINFNNEIWMLSDSTLWHSSNAITWQSAGTVPVSPGNVIFFSTLNNMLYIGDNSSTNGNIWASSNGQTWNILKSTDGNQIPLPTANSLSASSASSYSTVLIGDTLFLSATGGNPGTSIVWKITDWESPQLLTQYVLDTNTSIRQGQLIEFMGKLCLVETFGSSFNVTEYLLVFDNMNWHLASKREGTCVYCSFNHILFQGKLYAIMLGGEPIFFTK